MKLLAATLAVCSLAAGVEAQQPGSPTLEIQRQGSQPTAKGSADNFIGSVSVDQRFQRNDPARTGDVIWIPPGVRHWHGATATPAMTHVAIAGSLDGKVVDWMEQVAGEQYRRSPR